MKKSNMTPEEYEEHTRSIHPEWFDENGKRLPSARSGVRAPGGIYIPIRTHAESGIQMMPKEQNSLVPKGWKPTIKNPIPVIRCSKIKKDGERCGRWSVRGLTVCVVHGGGAAMSKEHAKAIVEAARLKIVGMAPDAVEVLNDLLQPGTSDAIRLKAAQDVLDRAGLKSALDIHVEVEHTVDAGALIAERLASIASRSKVEEIEVEIEIDVVDVES